MKKLGVIVGVTAALLLGGCASTPAPAATVTVTAEAEVTPKATAAPLVASTEAPEASGDDAQFLSEVRLRLQSLPDATDEQLLAAGQQACDLYAQGQSRAEMRLIEGEKPDASGQYWDSGVIATWAAKVYCIEYDG